ncbi:molybdopterin molybdotransferase MoeA [Vulcanisaeta distributa]|uniref:MoeA domain protein domain I and II n=1 Tax=Vulcanisaeta distributa (strain DSM 14429 / JCM 11212 / NBRC 100878 / IC-017) TaxID=572478 RepID=E1QNS1_VULDI|nr:molybdopterin molybdotransferase MoeA [Vulcanisaeta distributa]ADN50167.1 MoeA domain protein domain I and II [Vulcanisaeta distributa DSM 14429]
MKPHEYKFVVPHELEELINAISTLAVVDEEKIPVWESMGRVLSRDVVVPMDIPPRPKAAYDGYAVRSQDITRVPTKLRLVGSISIGEVPSIKVGPMETAYVTTGAYLPDGADAVVPEEFVEVMGNNEVIINKSVMPWENVDPAGDFAKKGEVALREGTVIMPWDIPALLELGIGEVWVRRRVKIFVVATGSELVEVKTPDEVPNAIINGKVVESTASLVRNYIGMYVPYAEVVGRTIVPDNQEAIKNAVMNALNLADIVITTGGTGPSGVDYVYEVTKSLNPRTYIRGLRMRPGRPTGLAVLSNNKVVINLSGHPISALNAMTVIVKEVIKRLAGVKVDIAEPRVMAKLARGTLGDEEFARQYRVRVRRVGNDYVIEELPRQGSSLTHTLLTVNGLVFTRKGQIIREGDYVEVLLLREPPRE